MVTAEKLGSSNSYQRSLGVMLIAANAKWDAENKMDTVIDKYLAVLGDEKLYFNPPSVTYFKNTELTGESGLFLWVTI